MGLLNTILDVIFPAYCIVCRTRGAELCLKCLAESPEAERESLEWVFPLYDYRHPGVKKAVWLLKYKGKRRLAPIFAEAIYGRILEELADFSVMENFSAPLLIPIPLSRARLRERGFNQALLICKELIRLDNNNNNKNNKNNKNFSLEKDILIKPKDTEHQARIENRSLRLKNIIGSFAVKNTELIKKRNIILIDDVTTTGATLAEARKMLKQSGARKIIAFTIAH